MDTLLAEIGFWSTARDCPDRMAIIAPNGEQITYGELAARANQLTHALRALGLGAGDGIAILQPNNIEFITAVLAAGQAGLFYTPLNPNLVPSEIAFIIQNSETKAFIAHERFGEKARAAAIEAQSQDLVRLAVGEIEGFFSYQSLLDAQPTDSPIGRQAGSLMSYTSGTTGRPKGVRRPLTGLTPEEQDHHALAFNMLAVWELSPGGNHVHLCVSPLYHNAPGGYAMFALQLGQTIVLMDKFKPEPMLALVQRNRVTNIHMVPIQFYRLLELAPDVRDKYDLTSLQLIAHGGAPCSPEIKSRMLQWLGPIIYEYYSASEGVGGTIATPQDALERPGTVGRPFRPGSIVKILDEYGKEMPRGEIGAVFTSVAGNAFKYFKDDQKSAAARQGDLFTVGDFGHMDDDGYLYLASRRTDLILSGGVNIYPAEIESALIDHPSVADAAVFGIPNVEWGEEIKAVVELAPGVTAGEKTVSELVEHCRSRLARFKVPKTIDFVKELPRDPNGKMYKRKLRDPYWQKADAK